LASVAGLGLEHDDVLAAAAVARLWPVDGAASAGVAVAQHGLILEAAWAAAGLGDVHDLTEGVGAGNDLEVEVVAADAADAHNDVGDGGRVGGGHERRDGRAGAADSGGHERRDGGRDEGSGRGGGHDWANKVDVDVEGEQDRVGDEGLAAGQRGDTGAAAELSVVAGARDAAHLRRDDVCGGAVDLGAAIAFADKSVQ
jgi:hypothetical protein